MKNWNRFVRRVIINRNASDIYQMWATPGGLTTWFLKTANYKDQKGNERKNDEFYKAGDTYHWEWHNWDGSSQGQVIEQNGSDKLKMEFASSLVDVTVEPFDDGRTLLSLIQSDIADDEESKLQIYCGCSCGWTFWLANLKAYMEHGILLNESGDKLKGRFDGYELVNT